MKRVEHLEDRVLHVLLNRDARTERATSLVRIEDDGDELALRALPERARDLTHHLDVENVQRRPRERDPRDAVVDVKVNVLVRGCHRQS